jgi:hypothetical protein
MCEQRYPARAAAGFARNGLLWPKGSGTTFKESLKLLSHLFSATPAWYDDVGCQRTVYNGNEDSSGHPDQQYTHDQGCYSEPRWPRS